MIKMDKLATLTFCIGILFLNDYAGGQSSIEEQTRYAVTVAFDTAETRLMGHVIIDYHNRSGMDLATIPMFFRNDDKEENLIQRCTVNGESAEFEYRFKNGSEGYCGVDIDLPEMMASGERSTIRIAFMSTRGAFFYDYYHFCHHYDDKTDWLPTVLVMEHGKIYPSRQSLSDYEVTLTLPADFTCAATGTIQSESASGDTKTLYMKAQGVPDFGILLSRDFIVEEAEAAGVLIQSFYFEKEKKWGKYLLEKARDIVPFYADTIGFYPQPIISILPGHSEPWGGYPVCANCVVIHMGLDKKGDDAEEFANWILAHEIGHEYFGFGHILEDYEYPQWFGLSMGIYTDYLYNSARGIHRSDFHTRWRYYMAGILAGLNTTILRKVDDLDREGFDWNNVIAHSKSSTVLSLLQQLVGTDTFWIIYKTYLNEHRGKTVTLESFKNTCESISGMELDWFFHQWYETPAYLDYRVEETNTWKAGSEFITECRIVRKGDAVMPLTAALVTTEGDTIRQDIDGWFEERTLTFRSVTGPSRFIIDPDKSLPLMAHAEQSFSHYGIAGMQLQKIGKNDEALHLYQNAYTLAKDFSAYWYFLGVCYRNVGDYVSGIESFRHLDDCKDDEYRQYKELSILELGKTYDLMGRRDEAKKQYQEALKSDRTKEEAEKYLERPFVSR